MSALLANAESWDATQTDFVLILLCATGIGIVCALVAVVFLLGRRSRHRRAGAIGVAAMFWGLISVGSILYVTITQLSWAKSNFLELLSGYGDPGEKAPALPWLLWTALAGFYLLMLGWITSGPGSNEKREGDRS